LVHRSTNEVGGCVRLILPSCNNLLPIQHLVDTDTRNLLRVYPADRIAEVSRYAVSKTFRRRVGDCEYAEAASEHLRGREDRRLGSHITLGLLVGVAKLSAEHNILYLCAVMAPSLLRLFGKLGLHFDPLGSTIGYHGVRQPCIANVQDLLESLQTKNSYYYNMISSEFDSPVLTCPS
jgi:N-acyl amino acid synthase of PEP-CTERM/exosortase system